MKRILLTALIIIMAPAASWAAKTTYIVTNHRFNYVKVKEIKGSEAEARRMTHPMTLNEQGVRAALESVKLSRGYVLKKEVDTQRVFDDDAIDFLAPGIVRAFAKATPMEQVIISYLSKNPIFILRNDRLNIASMWISGNKLYIHFMKLYAKITGDIDKRGNEARAASKARGLRVKLELAPGQTMAANDLETLILDLNYDYATKPGMVKTPLIDYTMSGQKVETYGKTAQESAKKEKKAKAAKTPPPVMAAPAAPVPVAAGATAGASMAGTTASSSAPSAAPATSATAERLRELDRLQKEGLINKKEYDAKRKEILKDL